MREIVATTRYRRAYRKLSKHKQFPLAILEQVITAIAGGESLAARHRDHALSGTLKQFRECHITPDLLLVYQLSRDKLVLVLVDLGTHSSLFGN